MFWGWPGRPLTPTVDVMSASTIDRARRDIAAACRQPTRPAVLLDDILAALRRVLPVDGAFISATDPATTLFASAAVIDNMPEHMCAPFMDNEFLVDDFNKFSDLHRTSSGATTLHRATFDRLARSPRHAEVNTPMGFGPELRATFSSGEQCWGVLHLLREQSAPDFTDDDLAFVDAVTPTITEGLRRSALGVRALPADADLTAPGVITIGPDGVVTSLNDTAVTLLEELSLRPVRPIITASGVDLPGEAYMVAACARARALGRPGPPPVTRAQGRSGGWFTLRGDCTKSVMGGADTTVVVVQRARSSEVVPLVVAGYALSAREEEVLAELTAGRATAEIGQRLFISPHTVRDHIKSILEKTGTTSRGELLSKLFSLHYQQATEFVHQ